MKIMVVASLYSSETPSGENLFVQNLIKTFEKLNVHCKLFIVDTGENSNSLFYKLKVAFIQIFNIGNSPLKALLILDHALPIVTGKPDNRTTEQQATTKNRTTEQQNNRQQQRTELIS